MRPRADEIIDSVVKTFEQYVVPEVEDPYAKSLSLTMANLMRLVKQQIEHEGPLLYADIEDLRSTLTEVRAYLGSQTELGERFAVQIADLDRVLAEPSFLPDVYPTLAAVGREVDRLKWALQHALIALDRARPDLGDAADYQAIRTRVRQYLRRSIEREGQLVLPAFTGERR